MADAAIQPDEFVDSSENPVVPQILRDISTLVLGTEQQLDASLIRPEAVLEGAQVFPPRDEASKASPSTTYILNPVTRQHITT